MEDTFKKYQRMSVYQNLPADSLMSSSLISSFIQVLVESIPRLLPVGTEHIFKSGSTFYLLCEAKKPIEWSLPSFIKVCVLNTRMESNEMTHARIEV